MQRSIHLAKTPVAASCLLLACLAAAAPVHAATCSVKIGLAAGKITGECADQPAANALVVFQDNVMDQRGRKLLVPRGARAMQKTTSYVSISPSVSFLNGVLTPIMVYTIVIVTAKGSYSFGGEIFTASSAPPQRWWRGRPNDMVRHSYVSTEEMLAELRALPASDPALDPALIEAVVTRKQDLTDKLPTLLGVNTGEAATEIREVAGASAVFGPAVPTTRSSPPASVLLDEANRAGKPVASPALDQLIKRVLGGAR